MIGTCAKCHDKGMIPINDREALFCRDCPAGPKAYTKMIAATGRVETGAVQFGDDWPGDVIITAVVRGFLETLRSYVSWVPRSMSSCENSKHHSDRRIF